jgi:hypothetical protein
MRKDSNGNVDDTYNNTSFWNISFLFERRYLGLNMNQAVYGSK